MTARSQDDSLWVPVVYDGSKKGEYIVHSLGDGGFVKWPVIHSANAEARQAWINKVEEKEPAYQFTVWETGETWTVPMPEGSPIPDAKVTIGFLASAQLIVNPAPYTTDTIKEAVQIAKDLNCDLLVIKRKH